MEIVEYNGNNTKTYRLKIKKSDYLAMADSISKTLEKLPNIRSKYKAAGRSDKRFRWDMLWESGFNISPLYEYLNDSHIDTALRHIVK